MIKDSGAAGAAGQDPSETLPEQEATPEVPAGEEPATAEPSVAALEQELADLRDQRLRDAAELENVRRRAARHIENAHRYGTERFARELLSVADSMEMGLQSVPPDQTDSPLAEGLKATQKQLEQCLAKFGIASIDPQGQAFDPEEHEAMATQPTADQPPGTVILVVQKGYRIHERLLRPARVIVSRELDS